MRTYIVGTPMKTVHSGSRSSTWSTSNLVQRRRADPDNRLQLNETKRPCEWKSGRQCSRTSFPSNCQYRDRDRPLLKIFRWVNIAPLGRPVLPDVYKMTARLPDPLPKLP